jgi:hypothetical protein
VPVALRQRRSGSGGRNRLLVDKPPAAARPAAPAASPRRSRRGAAPRASPSGAA